MQLLDLQHASQGNTYLSSLIQDLPQDCFFNNDIPENCFVR